MNELNKKTIEQIRYALLSSALVMFVLFLYWLGRASGFIESQTLMYVIAFVIMAQVTLLTILSFLLKPIIENMEET